MSNPARWCRPGGPRPLKGSIRRAWPGPSSAPRYRRSRKWGVRRPGPTHSRAPSSIPLPQPSRRLECRPMQWRRSSEGSRPKTGSTGKRHAVPIKRPWRYRVTLSSSPVWPWHGWPDFGRDALWAPAKTERCRPPRSHVQTRNIPSSTCSPPPADGVHAKRRSPSRLAGRR